MINVARGALLVTYPPVRTLVAGQVAGDLSSPTLPERIRIQQVYFLLTYFKCSHFMISEFLFLSPFRWNIVSCNINK